MNGVRSSDQECYWLMFRSCAGGAPDRSFINRIMLRFRPIAPKPATCPDVSGGLSSDNNNNNNNNHHLNRILPKVRRKRKYIRVRKYTRKKPEHVVKTKNEGFEHLNHAHDEDHENMINTCSSTTTQQLLPEKSDLNRRTEIAVGNSSSSRGGKGGSFWQKNRGLPTCWNSDKPASNVSRMLSDRVLVVQSWVTVECVTGTCIGKGLGSTDVERVMNLQRDTCPGFVSDGLNSVTWVNGAFKRMVNNNNIGEGISSVSSEVVVGLVIKESFPSFCSAFSGNVKLQYASTGMEERWYSRTVPCDLWRMDGGGFAWRLDVEAALFLGR